MHFEHLDVRNNFETLLLNNRDIGVKTTNLSKMSFDIIDNLDTLVIPGNVTVGQLNGHDFETFLRKLCLKNVKCHIPSLTISGVSIFKFNASFISIKSGTFILSVIKTTIYLHSNIIYN